MITSFTNLETTAYVKYDPTNISESTGGVFEVSSNVLTKFDYEIQLYDSLRFVSANSIDGIVTSAGWYFLGLLGV